APRKRASDGARSTMTSSRSSPTSASASTYGPRAGGGSVPTGSAGAKGTTRRRAGSTPGRPSSSPASQADGQTISSAFEGSQRSRHTVTTPGERRHGGSTPSSPWTTAGRSGHSRRGDG